MCSFFIIDNFESFLHLSWLFLSCFLRCRSRVPYQCWSYSRSNSMRLTFYYIHNVLCFDKESQQRFDDSQRTFKSTSTIWGIFILCYLANKMHLYTLFESNYCRSMLGQLQLSWMKSVELKSYQIVSWKMSEIIISWLQLLTQLSSHE